MRSTAASACLMAGLIMATPAGAVDDGAVQRCRVMPDPVARLACYDALPIPAGKAAAVPAAAAAPAAVAPAAPAPTAAAPALAAAAAAAPDPASAQRFGFERKAEVTEIQSHIPGEFLGWGPRSRFTLANGQVWQINDESSGVYQLRDPKVTIRRAVFSGFEMDIDGARRVPRVKRLE